MYELFEIHYFEVSVNKWLRAGLLVSIVLDNAIMIIII